MKKLLIYLLILLAIILGLLKLFFDPIAKSLIEKNLTRDTCRVVSIQKVTTNLLKGSISIANFKIKNDKIFSRENLISIPLIESKLKISELIFGNIHFGSVLINSPNVNYDVVALNGKIIDSFYLLEGLLKNNLNNQPSTKLKQETQSTSPQANSANPQVNKGPQIDFVIDTLDIPKINISVLATDLQFSKNIILDKMTFQNVGNTKNSNHYKDVMAMIVTNMVIKINNEVITGNLKKKFEKKLKNLLSSEKLKSIIGSDSDKLINKLDKFFK